MSVNPNNENKTDSKMTPLMKQYWDIKSLHQDKILFFRMGDFYELFFDDALKAAPLLGITLTQRNKKSEDQTPMCGMPYHSVAGYINKLLSLGLKIALCDQIEDPKLAKGLVKRAVTRILTPGMVYDVDLLDPTSSNYLASLDSDSLSLIEASTGEAFYFKSSDFNQKRRLIETLSVAEFIIDSDYKMEIDLNEFTEWLKTQKIVQTFFKFEDSSTLDSKLPRSARLLYSYVLSLTQADFKNILQPFKQKEFDYRLQLSAQTLRHLEIFSNYKGFEKGSLFHAINRTRTSAGARLLKQRLLFPLQQKASLEKRYDLIEIFRQDLYKLKLIRDQLSYVGDIERRLAKISQPQGNAKDLLSLADSLFSGLKIYELSNQVLDNTVDSLSISNLVQKIKSTIKEDAVLTLKQGQIIQKGVSAELDELIDLSLNSEKHIEKLENTEKEKTGISSLKIRYNNVFGYYIEITNTHKDKVPARYQRKQTLAQAERYCTDELIELERKVLSALTKRNELEFSIFENLRQSILIQTSKLIALSVFVSEIDVITGLSWLSLEENYVRPLLNEDKKLKLIQSRHPVVEQMIRGQFVANNIELDPHQGYLITGPNMAGKSTLMRQVALSVILAQMGSFVPASSAEIPIYDSIFTRIGASDQLSEGLSTFMVEMTETSQMLKEATERSLLILDEVGRGTATYDGLSLAQAILEHILSTLKTHFFFATHYHELTRLDQSFPELKNVHMKIFDENKKINFLYILSPGPAGQSYGVQVAEIAGLPPSVIKRAREVLEKLETSSGQMMNFKEGAINQATVNQATVKGSFAAEPLQLDMFSPQNFKIESIQKDLVKEIKNTSIQNMSPLQALNKIAQWQEKLI